MRPGQLRRALYEGDHYSRGLRRGRRLRATLTVPDLSHLGAGFVRACQKAAEAFYPPAVREFEGLVDGGGFELEAMRAFYFARLESMLGGCTMVALAGDRDAGGRSAVVGRNYDWAVQDSRWCELHVYRPPAPRVPLRIGYTHHWAGCPDVLNAAGLYVGIASLPPEPVPRPGVQWSIIVDGVSERCATVEHAVDLLVGVRHLRPLSYLLADGAGEVAVVEATPSGVAVRGPQGGFVAAANVPIGGRMMAGDGPTPTPVKNSARVARSFRRLERVREVLSAAGPAADRHTMERLLCDHKAPICTGPHAGVRGCWGTIWSAMCLPAEGLLRIAPGRPCQVRYTDVYVDAH